MSLVPTSASLAEGVQGLSGLLTIITSDGVEEQILKDSSGPLVMAACMLGSSGQLGVLRAAAKILIGLSNISKANIEVKHLKHVSKDPLDSIAYGEADKYGLNPRSEQPLLTDYIDDRHCLFWFYFGSRPSKEQEKENKRLTKISLFCSIVAALLTGTTAIPICIDNKKHYPWVLAMLNPFGLCILAVAFAIIRGNIQRCKQDSMNPPDIKKPKLGFIGHFSTSSASPDYSITSSDSPDYSVVPSTSPEYSFSSIGFIDERALETYPADGIVIRLLLFLGIVFVLIGYIASFAFIQERKRKYSYVWIGMQVFFLFLRYTVWFLRPFAEMKYKSTEMGCKAKRLIANQDDLRSDLGLDFILCLAAARSKRS